MSANLDDLILDIEEHEGQVSMLKDDLMSDLREVACALLREVACALHTVGSIDTVKCSQP